MLKSLPSIPIAKVCETPVIPLIEATLLLKVFQSNAERAPVVVDEDSMRLNPDPEIINPFVDQERKLTLLLNRDQSPAERAPVEIPEARPREIPLPTIESPFAGQEIRLTLLLNVVQSSAERAPVVVEFARARESPVPTRESPFVGVRICRDHCLLLKRVQSVPVRRPVEVALAFPIWIVTFGPTVLLAPLVIVIAEFVVEKLPNVRAFCLLLKVL